MVRFSLPLVAVALAVSVVGCSHCDTCDKFPVPCVGHNTGAPVGAPAAYTVPPAGEMPMVAPPSMVSNGSAPINWTSPPPTTGAFTPPVSTPSSAVPSGPLPRGGDNSPPPPTSLGDAPKG
jgi:hypothetical protein